MRKSSIFFCCVIASLYFNCNIKRADKVYEPEFRPDTSGTKTLIWGFPSFSYCENAEQIVKYLNQNLTGTRIIVKACVSWDEYTGYLDQNRFDITLVNGIEALEATKKGYVIFGKIGDDSQYKGVIFTRKDAGINSVKDLKGKTIALVQSGMVPGTMLPLYYLQNNGLDVNDDIKKINVSSFESAIITTYLGKSEGGVCMKRSWEVYVRDHPEVLNLVELKWVTPSILNNALLIDKTIDDKTISQLKTLFFSMHETDQGKAALKKLGISGFEHANANTYASIKDFKKKYDSVIH